MKSTKVVFTGNTTKDLHKAIPNDDFPTKCLINGTWYYVDPEELYHSEEQTSFTFHSRSRKAYEFDINSIEMIVI